MTAQADTELIYSIVGYSNTQAPGMGGQGFSILLARPYVDRIIESDIKRSEEVPLYKALHEQLYGGVLAPDRGLARLRFYRDTWLLIGIIVGGQCACFGIDGGAEAALDRPGRYGLRYSPHNIDTVQQASTILSSWLLWFNTTQAITGYRQPFTY